MQLTSANITDYTNNRFTSTACVSKVNKQTGFYHVNLCNHPISVIFSI
jgi:hypothetical protein